MKEKYNEQTINETSGDPLIKILKVLKKAAENEESAVFKSFCFFIQNAYF